MNYNITTDSDFGECRYDGKVNFKSSADFKNAFFEVNFNFPEWEEDAFVFLPASAYNGNKFTKVKRPYKAIYQEDEYGVDNEPLIIDIPSMEKDGKGLLEVTSADMALPCAGIFYRSKKEGIFIITPQQIKDKNIGYSVKNGNLKLTYPANRKNPYYVKRCRDYKKLDERGIEVTQGEELTSEIYIKEFKCNDFIDFYNEYFKIRKLYLNSERVGNLYTEELWEMVEDMTNNLNWSGKTYPTHTPWRAGGWTDGCGVESSIFLKKGNELSKRRAVIALDYDTNPEHLTKAGFLYTTVWGNKKSNELQLTRKSAASCYHLARCLELTTPKEQWVNCVKTLADAFVNLFLRYGKFGSYIDPETGDILVGFGHSGVMAIGALAKCGTIFKKTKYTEIAIKSAEYYYKEFLDMGMTCGGPGDVLSAPDSESAFMFLESLVALYEATMDKKWLEASETILKYCSSWVVSYVHKFPKDSEFDRLNINTVGSVIASVQNTHSAPGICTLSGESIYKVYKYTGKVEYLDFIKDIAYFIPQCISTVERPIYAVMGEPEGKKRIFPKGWINERVNMSDWERLGNGQGNVFYHNCWPSNSFLATYADLMEYPEFKE